MEFTKWLYTMLEEKRIDMEDTFEIESENSGWNLIPIGAVAEYMTQSDVNTQGQMKNNLVAIDFKNGDIKHFLKYVAQFMADHI